MADEKDEEISINLSKIKNIFKKKEKDKVKALEKETQEIESEVNEEIKEEEKKIQKIAEEKEDIEKVEEKLEQEEKEAEIIDQKEEQLKEEKQEIEKDIKETKKDIDEIKEKAHSESDEEIKFDLSKIKNIFKRKPKGEEQSETKAFLNKYGIFLLLLIPIILSTFFRAYPYTLPATDDWAENSVHNSIKSQIQTQIDQQYPNLPDQNKAGLVEAEFQKSLKENNVQIQQQIVGTSNYFKSRLQNENGQTYLLAIDPYLWYGEARNYVEYGHLGDKLVDGKSVYTLRDGRVDKKVNNFLHPFIIAFTYKIINFFNKDFTLLKAAFILPLLIIGLSIIPAFFIGKKLGGKVGALFAGIILAINAALLGRTPAGFSDTDAYNVLLPLLAAWLFLESIESENIKKQLIFSGLAGLVIGIYSFAWGGWWYIFDFLIATIIIYLVITLIMNVKKSKNLSNSIKTKNFKNTLVAGSMFFVSTGIFVSLVRGLDSFINTFFIKPLSIITLKDVGISKIWPNVLTTVAEFNEVPLEKIISQMGGPLLFYLAIAGIILALFHKNSEGKIDLKYSIFLTVWFVGSAYGFTKGIRFAILMVPAFAIALGIAIGIIYEHANKWISKNLQINQIVSSIAILLLLSLLLISPLKSANATAKGEIPSMNDAWYDSLTGIHDDADDAIITSWWDFGHWFVTTGQRRVTFDGGDQGRRIHWVGRSLLESNETTAIGILNMLNCGQEYAYDTLNNFIDDELTSYNLMMEIIVLNKKDASEKLKQNGLTDQETETVLAETHCEDLIPQYYITSQDMIGKAGVWAHFGSWDFEKASMYNKVNDKDYDNGIQILTEEFNLTNDEADNIYYEITTTKADRWVSPWPSYRSGLAGCSIKENIVQCGNGAEVNLETLETSLSTQGGKAIPYSIVYATKDGVEEKIFEDNQMPMTIALIPNGNSYRSILMDKELAKSTFTKLFFFEGHGSEHFTIFSDKTTINGERIQVWKVSFEKQDKFKLDQFKDKKDKTIKAGNKVSVGYIGWLENGTIFDSNIINWQPKGITNSSPIAGQDISPFSFTVRNNEVVKGFDDAVLDMKINETKVISILPDEAYGTNPDAHPLGNKTLNFKIFIADIE